MSGRWIAGILLWPGLMVAACQRQPIAPTKSPRTSPAPSLFTEVTTAAGLHFRHRNGATGRKLMPEMLGSGCGFFDYDNDGWLDILLLNGRPLEGTPSSESAIALFRNHRDGTFSEVTAGSGLEASLYAMGCATADYDNDGFDDLFVTTCLDGSRLYRNLGDGKFENVTDRAGLTDPLRRWGTSCAWFDYDCDGWVDLFVCHYVRLRSLRDDRYCSWQGRKAYCLPLVYEGETCALYRNLGNGTFADVSAASGIAAVVGKSLGVTTLDYDRDGWPDLAVANDGVPNFLFRNRSDGTFAEVGMQTGFAVAEDGNPRAGMGIDAADVLNDGGLFLLVSNFAYEGLSLFRREGAFLSEVSASSGLAQPSLRTLGFGLFFLDYDNDGYRDAFVTNGHIFDHVEAYQSDVTFRQRPQLFRNLGTGRFVEVSRRAGAAFQQSHVGRGAARGDFDNDGDLDILLSHNSEGAQLLRNDCGRRRPWVQLELRGRGPGASNRNGIGAVAKLTANGVSQTDWVRGGSSYLSQSDRQLHFGLGGNTRTVRLEIQWPSGRRQQLEPGINAKSVVFEPLAVP